MVIVMIPLHKYLLQWMKFGKLIMIATEISMKVSLQRIILTMTLMDLEIVTNHRSLLITVDYVDNPDGGDVETYVNPAENEICDTMIMIVMKRLMKKMPLMLFFGLSMQTVMALVLKIRQRRLVSQ